MIYRIAVEFGDNDFWSCFNVLGSLLVSDARLSNLVIEDKKKLATAFSAILQSAYWLVQNGGTYGDAPPDDMKYPYLTIRPESIFLNEEVDAFLEAYGRNQNGEMLFVDLENNQYTVS